MLDSYEHFWRNPLCPKALQSSRWSKGHNSPWAPSTKHPSFSPLKCSLHPEATNTPQPSHLEEIPDETQISSHKYNQFTRSSPITCLYTNTLQGKAEDQNRPSESPPGSEQSPWDYRTSLAVTYPATLARDSLWHEAHSLCLKLFLVLRLLWGVYFSVSLFPSYLNCHFMYY